MSTVLPASIDTPLFQHGANYSGRAAAPTARNLYQPMPQFDQIEVSTPMLAPAKSSLS